MCLSGSERKGGKGGEGWTAEGSGGGEGGCQHSGSAPPFPLSPTLPSLQKPQPSEQLLHGNAASHHGVSPVVVVGGNGGCPHPVAAARHCGVGRSADKQPLLPEVTPPC